MGKRGQWWNHLKLFSGKFIAQSKSWEVRFEIKLNVLSKQFEETQSHTDLPKFGAQTAFVGICLGM